MNKRTTYHVSIGIDYVLSQSDLWLIGMFNDLHGNPLHPKEARRRFLELKEQGLKNFCPACDNTDADGLCLGHVVEEGAIDD